MFICVWRLEFDIGCLPSPTPLLKAFLCQPSKVCWISIILPLETLLLFLKSLSFLSLYICVYVDAYINICTYVFVNKHLNICVCEYIFIKTHIHRHAIYNDCFVLFIYMLFSNKYLTLNNNLIFINYLLFL